MEVGSGVMTRSRKQQQTSGTALHLYGKRADREEDRVVKSVDPQGGNFTKPVTQSC